MKELNRFKSIFKHSLEKITKEIERHRSKFSSSTVNKKSLQSPSALIELFNNETLALMNTVKNSFNEE